MSPTDNKKNDDKEKIFDTESEKVSLRVQNAKKRDYGRNIIRIDRQTMERLEIQTGDVIALFGKKLSAGIAWPSYPQDNDLGIIRIDPRIRKNTGTAIDDMIDIRKIRTQPAQTIVLAPSNIKIKTNPIPNPFLSSLPFIFSTSSILPPLSITQSPPLNHKNRCNNNSN